MYSFNKYSLSCSYGSGAVPGAGNKGRGRGEDVMCASRACVLVGESDNGQLTSWVKVYNGKLASVPGIMIFTEDTVNEPACNRNE